jgi:exosortase
MQIGVEARPALFSWHSIWTGPNLVLIALAACWFLFFDELLGEWQLNPQYNYGYVVPFLTAILVWRRWPERPEISSRQRPGLVLLAGAFLLFLQLPLRLAIQANPEWRLIYWLHGFQALGLSFCLLFWLGGWRWVRLFAPPLIFVLIAVPWPMDFEQKLTQGLMRFVAGLTVDVADWLNIPALQDGNLVAIGTGVVGIDEACSGVRSLQSALMLSLFLGEMNRFSVLRRLSLLVGSMLFVLLANLTRTTFLVWAAAHRGMRQMEAWHDLAGILIMIIVLPGLLLLAHWMKPKEERPIAKGPAHPSVSAPIPIWVGLIMFAWIATIEATTEIWYRSHESHLIPNARWTVAWPIASPKFQPQKLPDSSLALLRCSSSEAATWQDDEGDQWSAFFLRWEPGRNSAQLARGHSPEICLPASGSKIVENLGQVTVAANGLQIPFRHSTFESGDHLLHVFYSLGSDYRAPGEKPALDIATEASALEAMASRFRAILAGKRNLGQQALEITIQGPDSSDEALALLQKQLPILLRRQ